VPRVLRDAGGFRSPLGILSVAWRFAYRDARSTNGDTVSLKDFIVCQHDSVSAMKLTRRNPVVSRALCGAVLVAGILLSLNGATAQTAFEARHPASDIERSYLNVDINDELVTLSAHNAVLRRVLDEIAQQSGLAVASDDPLDTRLTLQFDRIPLSEALIRILRYRSFLLHRADSGSGERKSGHGHRGTLWVFSDAPVIEAGHEQTTSESTMDRSSVVDLLEMELMSNDMRVRQTAIKRLRKLEAVAPLGFALEDEDRNVRVSAIHALTYIGGDDAAAALASALGDEDSWVRAELAYAFGTLGGDTAMQVLSYALDDADTDVRLAAIEAFTDIGGGESANALAAALHDRDISVRLEAVDALAEIGGTEAIGLLDHALQDKDTAVKNAANNALTELMVQGL
jgi:hypothetical protein